MAVPPRWINCPRKGTVIAGKFLPFKTLLDSRYDGRVSEANRFQLPMLLGYLSSQQAEMGMVIDLTKTNRFYDKEEMKTHNIRHVKLECQGRGETPTRDQVATFIQICDTFFDKNPNSIIGVHCTHGFNTTGFMIIAYLIERLEWSLEAAVREFTRARPTGIYKEDYIKELIARYGDETDDLVVPSLPDWCIEDDGIDIDVDDDGQRVVGGLSENGDSQKQTARRKQVQPRTQFMEGVPDIEAVKDAPKIHELQTMCQKMCNWTRHGFPGCQPVSMDTKNIGLLFGMPYKVSWKADGTRYMMLIVRKGEVYLFDRDNTVFAAPQFTFLRRKQPNEHIQNTLVDGELVIDKDRGHLTPRFLIYDIVVFEGSAEFGKSPLDKRLLYIEKELIEPRALAEKEGKLNKEKEPFRIRLKQFWDVRQTRKVLENVMPQLSHGHDGLIFSPAKEPYTPGQCFSVLKWKPSDLNSVDFRLKVTKTCRYGELPETHGQLYVGGYEMPFSIMKPLNKEMRQLDGKIVECMWNPARQQWVFMRVRDDKTFPNNWKTAQGVCESIEHPVTKEKLLEFIEIKLRAADHQKIAGQQPHHLMLPGKASPSSSHSNTADSLLMPPPKIPRTK